MSDMSRAGLSSVVPSMIGLLVLFIGALALVAIPLKQLSHTNEPLADSFSLQQMMLGKTLPTPVEDLTPAVFHAHTVFPPSIASLTVQSLILGVTSDPLEMTEKRIEVDLTHQKVYAFEGQTRVYEFTVSTGKWGRTPTGEFRIWTKVKSQLMKGGNKDLGTYYYLPNVPWVMFFYNDSIAKMRGFSFHGTYWHNNFGHPMSHGCVNMKIDEAKLLYDWATPVVTNTKAWSTLATTENAGTKVLIYGEAPQE